MMKVLVISFLFLIGGCDPIPKPNPHPPNDSAIINDSTLVLSGWEIMEYNYDGHPVFFIKDDGDSTTTISIINEFVDYDMPYAIREDMRIDRRRMISIAPAYMVIADSSKWFDLSFIPDKIDYDRYSPNKIGD